MGESDENPAGLGSAKDPGARAVVRINTRFFHDGKPRHAVRCLTLRYNVAGSRRPDLLTFGRSTDQLEFAVLVELHKTFDWKAVLAVLDKP